MMIVVAPDEAGADQPLVTKFQQRLIKECYRATAGGGLMHQQGDQFVLFYPITSSSSPTEAKRFGEQIVQLAQMTPLKFLSASAVCTWGCPGSLRLQARRLRVSRL
jgi:hypothetical protein